MTKLIFTFGTLAGLIVGIPMFAVTVARSAPPYGMAASYLVMLIALSAVFVGIKRHRDRALGGVIGFWPAFGLGIAISAVAGVLYVGAWEAAVAVAHLDFPDLYAKSLIAQQQAKGASAAALAKLTAQMQDFKVQYANPAYRLPMTFAEIFPVGLLVSLVSAALLRNRRFMPAQRSSE